MIAGVELLLILRQVSGFAATEWALLAILLASAIFSLVRYSKIEAQAVLTFGTACFEHPLLGLAWRVFPFSGCAAQGQLVGDGYARAGVDGGPGRVHLWHKVGQA